MFVPYWLFLQRRAYKQDMRCRISSKTDNIDLILGGHTHTFLPEPQSFINRKGTKFCKSSRLGWSIARKNRLILIAKKKIKNIAWNNQVIDDKIMV